MLDHREELRQIRTFPALVKYLRDKLDWPIDAEDFDDLTFDYEPEELGLDCKTAAKIDGIKQLRPLVANQPWGIFFVKFEPKRLPVVALRRILGQLVFKKRASANRSERPAWAPHDLLFISAFGEGDERQISFAHFSEDAHLNNLATLRVLGWDGDDTGLRLDHVYHELHDKLQWPANPGDVAYWRRRWSLAFTLRYREVIATSKDLALELAELARKIRRKVNAALKVESESGKLRRLMAAFRESLMHDLDEDDFADMYAQTIAYGLLSARVSRQSGALVADDVALMVPVTSPFLRELMETFLNLGGRKRKANGQALDFDELGIADVVEMLRAANMEAVLLDFDNRNPQEDPVIHFYELFLKEYDVKKRMQRGVFYTPKPVVSYIARSVHELLQTEFGLADGLADTTTWGEMAARACGAGVPPAAANHAAGTAAPQLPPLTIPDGVSAARTLRPNPRPGHGNRHVPRRGHRGHPSNRHREVEAAGPDRRPAGAAWNDYVPKHLLPRLHGYELLMAPYAIAHMKIGLKLAETGYRFQSNERVRVYLTNALEPPPEQDRQMTFANWCPALAHEAAAVNEIKRHKRFTVVIGNPPYSKISSNLTPEMRATVERYRYLDGVRIKERGALQFEINLQDDYVKFFRLCEDRINSSGVGILGLITNNGYLSTPTLRGMRDSLLETFRSIRVLDLHGHLAKGEVGPDGTQEENVFDIVQGVSLFLGDRTLPKTSDGSVFHAECYGSRAGKYSFLQSNNRSSTSFAEIAPSAPFYLFVPHDAELAQEWKQYVGLAELFPKNSAEKSPRAMVL